MNLRIFFLHTDPSYTYRIMPPSLSLSPPLSPLPVSPPPSPSSPSSSFFQPIPLPAHHLTHSLTHFHTLPIRRKEKEKNTHKTNTSYLPNDLLTDLPTYLLYALRLHFFLSLPLLLSRYKLTLPYRTCRTLPEQRVNELIHPSIHPSIYYITFHLRNVM